MISVEAAREGGRSKLWTRFSQNLYGKKLPKLYQSLGIIGWLCRVSHEELLKALWFDAQGL